MRVRFLSGNLAGCEQDLPQVDAEVAIATGYAEAASEPPPSDPVIEAPTAPADVDADAQASDDQQQPGE